jgi:hypothetical protein
MGIGEVKSRIGKNGRFGYGRMGQKNAEGKDKNQPKNVFGL